MIIFVNVAPEIEKSKDNSKEIEDATESLKKQLFIEKSLKTQAVNKLAEIMCRKDFMQRENSKKRKATSDDLRKKEKECRKLHQELGAVSWTSGFTAFEVYMKLSLLSSWEACHLRARSVKKIAKRIVKLKKWFNFSCLVRGPSVLFVLFGIFRELGHIYVT